MRYAWVITIDNVTPGINAVCTHGEPLRSRVGWTGPRGASETDEQRARKHGRAFRMLCDGDTKPSYHGRIWTEDEPGGDDDLSPLDDLGAPDAGCTQIEYYQDGKWVGLL